MTMWLLPLVSILIFSLSPAASNSFPILCHETERSALLQFNQSLSLNSYASSDPSAYPKTVTWNPFPGNASDCCLWDGVVCDKHSGRVIELDLSSSYLYGSILPNSTLFQLVHLQSVNLSDNDFRYSLIPSELGRLVNLKYLNLSKSTFFGQVPIQVFTLSKLISLDLSSNVDPSSGSQLLKLQSPSLEDLAAQNLTSLEVLRLSKVNISSPVPGNVANLISLRSLRLYYCGLYGPLPQGIFLLPRLEVLSLGFNIFSGQIPPSIGNLSSLEMLSLAYCSFEGPIPYSIGKLSKLTLLELSSNNLTGNIPASLSNLTQLQTLDLSYNSLVGEAIPLANLTKLMFLFLSGNMLEGSIGGYVSGLKNLHMLFAESNKFVGPLDLDMFAGYKNLQALHLTNISLVFSSSIDNSTNYPQFVYLKLEACNMKRLPDFLHNQTRLAILSLAKNNIQGPILSPPPSLVYYDAGMNEFDGIIPASICNATSLQVLELTLNKLSGRVPPCLFNLSNHNLQSLSLSHNHLTGKIPETFTASCRLVLFMATINQIEGPIPRSLVNCTDLAVLDLGMNTINDTFPTWLSSVPSLQVLFLQSNLIHGNIPAHFRRGFSNLHIIYLGNNMLTGNIPEEFFQSLYSVGKSSQIWAKLKVVVPYFLFGYDLSMEVINRFIKSTNIAERGVLINLPVHIDLSYNNLVGSIPASTGNLTRLQALYLSNNNLTGSIPSSIGFLSNLEMLDLSHNKLSGNIPQELAGLTFLRSFDVSYNQLVGPVPNSQQFKTFTATSFVGNPGLCGAPLPKKCGIVEVPQDEPHDSGNAKDDQESLEVIDWVIRSLGYLGGLVVGLILGRIMTTENHEWFVKTFGRKRAGRGKKRHQRT